MDDLAVDSDEEVDYSKMDQVTMTPSMHCCSVRSPDQPPLPVCFRVTRRVLWAAGTSTPRRNTPTT